MSTRFGPRESNMGIKPIVGEVNKAFDNPFQEMMAIEAEYGSIFNDQVEN